MTGVLGCVAVFESDTVVLCTCGAFVFWGAALASLDCCSFSFLVLVFVGALQLYTGSGSTCDAVAELNAIPGLSGFACYVRTLSVVLLLRILWPFFSTHCGLVVGVLAVFC